MQSPYRFQQALLDAYEGPGARSGIDNRIRPTAELHKARQRIATAKRTIRSALVDFFEGQCALGRVRDEDYDSDGLDCTNIICSVCGKGDVVAAGGVDDDGDGIAANDILLCDHEGCGRCMHMQCVEPPVAPDEISEDQEEECGTPCIPAHAAYCRV